MLYLYIGCACTVCSAVASLIWALLYMTLWKRAIDLDDQFGDGFYDKCLPIGEEFTLDPEGEALDTKWTLAFKFNTIIYLILTV